MRLSLCLIARDEEELLPACLASVRGVVDEIVLADTGSHDRTREVARAAGAAVVEEPWAGDFARARNAALRRASGEWILVLDADERLAPGAGAVLRARLDGAAFDLGLLPLHNASRLDASPAEVLSGAARIGPPIRLPRLLRNAGGLAWRGVVHESVEDWFVRRGRRGAFVEADLVHLGAVPELRAARAKRQRNVELLRQRCRADPDDAAAHAYLAGELLDAGDLPGATAEAEQGWAAFDRQPRDRSLHRLGAVRAILALRAGDAARALESVARVEARQGRHVDLAWLRGRALELQAQRAAPDARGGLALAAARAFGEAADLRDAPCAERLTEAGAGTAARQQQGEALLEAGRPAQALEAFRRARAEDPRAERAALGEAEALLDLGDPGAALDLLEPLLGRGGEAWLLASGAAAALGAAGEADLFAERARERAASIGTRRRRRLAALGGGDAGVGR